MQINYIGEKDWINTLENLLTVIKPLGNYFEHLKVK